MGTSTTNLLTSCGLPTNCPPTSPGETVLHFLQDVELSQAEAARGLGITASRLNEVVKDKRGISADTALRLATYFGTTASLVRAVRSGLRTQGIDEGGGRLISAARRDAEPRAACLRL